ncbi:MAG: hypothetical protein LBE38_03900 [Deltaproteobacteria bacterium]|jgi:hypothetical protein|nr:hypothetical protein [Deltaproteobacteria bacterium]
MDTKEPKEADITFSGASQGDLGGSLEEAESKPLSPQNNTPLNPDKPFVIKRKKLVSPPSQVEKAKKTKGAEEMQPESGSKEDSLKDTQLMHTGPISAPRKRVVLLKGNDNLLNEIKSLKAEDGPVPKKKGKYQHKHPAQPPKRVRKILTRSNTEILKKFAELLELEKKLDPQAAKLREEKEKRRLESLEGSPLIPQKISKKAHRYLKKYGIMPPSKYDPPGTKKLLSFKLLFNYSPIEEMSDEDVMANIRLLFLAHADHRMPKTLDKFIKYMKNNMCFGISDEQLDRVMKLLFEYNYLVLVKDRVTVNIS